MKQIIVLDASDLKEIIQGIFDEYKQNYTLKPKKESDKRFVYGLKGIRELFNVSHVTAQAYKNTFLKPAIKQHGKKIIVDAELALKLFNNREVLK